MATKAIDRQTTTPFLLKLFYRNAAHHSQHEFLPNGSVPPHLQIYTWPTCSLRELTHLLTTALPSLLPDPAIGTRLTYRLFFPDMKDVSRGGNGRYASKELGSVIVGDGLDATDAEDTNGAVKASATKHLSGDADKTLQDVRFVIGDYVAVSVWPPLPNGEVAPVQPAPASAGPARGGPPPYRERERERERSGILGPPRENGYGGGYGRSRGGGRYGSSDYGGGSGVPPGEWRRGDMPPSHGGGYGRGRGRGRGW